MKRSERLEKINAINHGIENLAGTTLASVYNEYTAQLNRLEQLKIYKDEYGEQLKSRLSAQISSKEIQDYRYFFSSLEQAITQQGNVVKHQKERLESCQQDWLEKHQEVKKLDMASQKIRESEQLEEARKEQKQSDELNMRLFGAANASAKH